MIDDTIVAIATPRGIAARGVLRLSGREAPRIALEVLRIDGPGEDVAGIGRGIRTAFFEPGSRGARIQCALWIFRAPRSYTGEDVVEVHLPGSPLLIETAMDRMVRRGARVATPGEFTRRAVVNGRMKLEEAEAVHMLIRSRDDEERRAAVGILEGGLGRFIARWRTAIQDLLLPIEIALDFSDQDLRVNIEAGVRGRIDTIREAISEFRGRCREGARLRNAWRIVLEGPPNAGKSSLFNRLAGAPLAIVAPVAGTTRDPVFGEIDRDGRHLVLVDTAGGESATGDVALLAQQRRDSSLGDAELVVEVRDVRSLDPGRPPPRADRIRVLTHGDLVVDRPDLLAAEVLASPTADVSIEPVLALISRALSAPSSPASPPLLLNARHLDALGMAEDALARAHLAETQGRGGECLAADLREALVALAAITGEDAPQALLDRIFSSFCIGK